MAINYNAGFLPQQLYQNMFDAQRAGFEERNRRERERFKNLGNIAGNFIKYNQGKGDRQLKDFEERYKTQRDQLVNLRNTADPRTEDYKNVQDQINLLDQDYANMKQEFNQTGFLNMGRDESVLDLPDRTGTFAKKLINPRTGVPFIGGDEPIGDFQPASVAPESTKEAYALRDKQAEMGFLTEALKQRGIDTTQTELDFVGKLKNAKTEAEISSLLKTLGDNDLQELKRTVEGQAQLSKGRIENQILGEKTPILINQLQAELTERNAAKVDLEGNLITPKLQLYQGQADIQDQSYKIRAKEDTTQYGIREGINTTEQKKRGRNTAQTALEYLSPTLATKNVFETMAFRDREKIKFDNNIAYLREKTGLDTGQAMALDALRTQNLRDLKEFENKLSKKTPEEKAAAIAAKKADAVRDFMKAAMPPDGFMDPMMMVSTMKIATQMANDIYGGGDEGVTGSEMTAGLDDQTTDPSPMGPNPQGFIPPELRPLSTDIIDRSLELTERFPNYRNSKELERYTVEYNDILSKLGREKNQENQIQMSSRLVELQQKIQPLYEELERASGSPILNLEAQPTPQANYRKQQKAAAAQNEQSANDLNQQVYGIQTLFSKMGEEGVNPQIAKQLQKELSDFKADPANLEESQKKYTQIVGLYQSLRLPVAQEAPPPKPKKGEGFISTSEVAPKPEDAEKPKKMDFTKEIDFLNENINQLSGSQIPEIQKTLRYAGVLSIKMNAAKTKGADKNTIEKLQREFDQISQQIQQLKAAQ